MVDDRKKREYSSFIAAFIIHLILLILLPGITTELITKKKKVPPIEVTTKFVELVYPEVPKEVKVTKKEVKSVVISKEKGTKIKHEDKKKESIVKSKVKYDGNSLPKVKINKEPIKYAEVEKTIYTSKKNNPTVLSEVDTGDYRVENIGLKDIRGSGDLKSDNEVRSVKIKEKLESGEGKEVSTEKGVSKEQGISKVDSPKGVSVEVIEGKGRAYWGRYVEPEYPERAKILERSGRVGVLVNVDKYGNVKKVKIEEKSGNYEIDESVKKAARQWNVYIVDGGVNVPGTVRIGIRFIIK